MLDLEKSIIKKLIKQGKKDGYLTNELIKKSFPEDKFTSEQIEQYTTKLSQAGFDILSVSLDGTQRQREPRKAWAEAIEQDNLSNFTHVSELNGWGTKVRALYNFSSIPYTILLDKEGRIAGKNLKGQDLENKIKELLK